MLGALSWLIIVALLGAFWWRWRKFGEMSQRLGDLERKIHRLEAVIAGRPGAEVKPDGAPGGLAAAPPEPEAAPLMTPVPDSESRPDAAAKPSQPELAPALPPQPEAPPRRLTLPEFNWERFMGVKLLAWVGGLALFLGLAFFVKYSFDHDLITPEMRVAVSYCAAAALVAGGLTAARRDFAVLGQSLAATGILVLYATTFASHSFYRFVGFLPTFALMILITVTAFLLAVRLEAQVVAVLGLLGGFLTPILLSTGHDNPLGLFGYIALLDAGLIAIVRQRRWVYLAPLAALGTLIMQGAWVVTFFAVDKVYTAMAIFLGMEALFLAAWRVAGREEGEYHPLTGAALAEGVAALLFAFFLLTYPSLGARPGAIFTYALLADLGLMALALGRPRFTFAYFLGGSLFFLLLTRWTLVFLTIPLLPWGLFWYFVFAAAHCFFPIILARFRPEVLSWWWGLIFPGLAFLLVMLPILMLPELPLTVWVFVLLLNALVFGLTLVMGLVEAVLGALLLTMAAMGLWILRLPAAAGPLPELLAVIGLFAVFFFGAGLLAMRRLTEPAEPKIPWLADLYRLVPNFPAQISSLAVVLPFLLLVMVVLQLRLANPSPIFGLALLLVILLLGLARLLALDWLLAVGLGSTLLLEFTWHSVRFRPEFALVSLWWYLIFTAVFGLFPFLFRRSLGERVLPWIVAALSGPLHFGLIYRLAEAAYRNPYMGLLPAAFALPSLAGLLFIIRHVEAGEATRQQILAWWGGAALFFITLIFPIQFEKEWLTIGWALEGAALLWLFHRVPYVGLKYAGAALLGVAFVRLALNPAVLAYHARAAMPLLNWYLYAYGLTIACLLIGARLLRPPHHLIRNVNVLPWLHGMAGILAFLLLNIEIADYFSTGATLTFQFQGNFARDMTYSIAWALFAFGLLVLGIWRQSPASRYASLALLAVTLLKLFLHDLARLEAVYRIGAFIGVALVLLLASFTYQRFLAKGADQP